MPRRASADPLDRSRFPVDPWRLVECDFDRNDLGVTETLFTVANGYIGMRGNPEEGRHAFEHGTYVNGLHETWPIRHAEAAYGFARTGQTIVNAPDAKLMKLYVDDEPLVIGTADLEHYERALDFRDGVLRRSLVWRTPSGKRVKVDSTRMVSMTQRHLVVLTLEVTMLSGDAPLVVSSQLLNRQDGVDEYHLQADAAGVHADPRKAGAFEGRVLQPRIHMAKDDRMMLGYQCANSRMTVVVAADHVLRTADPYEVVMGDEPDLTKMVFRVDAQEGNTLRIEKAVAYHTSHGQPARAVRSLPAHPGPGRSLRPRPLACRAAGLVRRLLGGQRRRGRVGRPQPRCHPAGDPVQPLHARAGQRAGRRSRGRGEGGHGFGLRGPLLLGQRGLRRAVPQLHAPRDRPQPGALPQPDAACRS